MDEPHLDRVAGRRGRQAIRTVSRLDRRPSVDSVVVTIDWAGVWAALVPSAKQPQSEPFSFRTGWNLIPELTPLTGPPLATLLIITAWSAALLLLFLPGLLFGIKLLRPRWLPLWVVFTIIILGGWILANLAVHLRLAHLDHLVKAMDEIDENDPIVQAWVADGASMVFALVFGWAYGLVVTVAWLPVIGLGYGVAWWRSRRHRATQ